MTVAGPPPNSLTGFATLGAPVVGATVEVVEFAGLWEGAPLGLGETGQDGLFDVAVSPGYSGTALIRVSGASATWSEVATGDSASFDADDELLAVTVIDDGAGLAGVAVNGATTLATRLAVQYADGGEVQAAVTNGHLRIAEHLLRPSGFDLVTTPAVDLSTVASDWPLPRTAVSLFHAGVSRMAADLSEGGAPVTSMDVLQGLLEDLSDGLFDGVDAQGLPVVLVGAHPLDVETTRWTLAFHTDAFVDSTRNASGLDYEVLAADDGFYTLVSTDGGPLYPPGAPTLRFDELDPEIMFEAPSEDTWLSAPFALDVSVSDDSALTELTLIKPEAGVLDLVTDLAAGTLTATIDPSVLPDGALALVVSATDASDNNATDSLSVLVDTTSPIIDEITIPALFSSPSTPIQVTASDSTGGSGVASVTVKLNSKQIELEKTDGAWAGTPEWAEGDNTLTITATDVAGNQSTPSTPTGTLDSTPPTVALLNPTPGSWVKGGDPVTLTATASDAVGVQSVTMNLGDQEVDATEGAGGWTGSLKMPGVSTDATVSLSATDTAGNPSETVEAMLHVDAKAPTLMSFVVENAVLKNNVPYVSSTTATIEFDLKEDGAGVKSVCADLVCGTKTPTGKWKLTVDLESEGEQAIDLILVDLVDNEAEASVTVGRDTLAPDCTIDEPPIGLWFAQTTTPLSGTAKDSGVGGVAATLTWGETGLLSAGVGDDGAWTASPTLDPGQTQVTITCKDALENESDDSAAVHVDLKPPTIELGAWEFFNEAQMQATYSGSTLEYKAFDAPVHNAAVDCAAGPQDASVCSATWFKSTAQLDPDGANPAAFALLIEDEGSLLTTDELSIEFRFERDGVALTAPKPVPDVDENGLIVIPLSTETMVEAPTTPVPWTESMVPNALVVDAIDLAGNPAEHTFHFQLALVAPPVKLTPLTTWTPQTHDAASYELSGPDVATDIGRLFGANAPAQVAAQGGARVARYLAENPTAVPIAMIPNKLPLTVEADRHRAYLKQSQTVCTVGSCAKGQCLSTYGLGTCGPAAWGTSTVTLSETLPASVRAYPLDQQDVVAPVPSVLAPPLGTVVLAPGESVILDVLAEAPGSCLIGLADTFDGVASQLHRVHVANRQCDAFVGTDTTSDTAACPADGPSGPPFYGCWVVNHASPLALTALRMGTGPDESLTIDHYVPGFQGPAFDQSYPANFTFEATADSVPLSP